MTELLAIVAASVVLGVLIVVGFLASASERTKRRLDRRILRWWLRRTKREHRAQTKASVVVVASSPYRGGPVRVEEEKPDHTMLWAVVLVIVGVLGAVAVFR